MIFCIHLDARKYLLVYTFHYKSPIYVVLHEVQIKSYPPRNTNTYHLDYYFCIHGTFCYAVQRETCKGCFELGHLPLSCTYLYKYENQDLSVNELEFI